MKPERRPYMTFLGETLGYKQSKQIPAADLEIMVSNLRAGDRSMIEPIIMGHLRLVMGIIADNVRSRRKAADIEGAAFLSLVEAVNNCCPHDDEYGKHYPSRLRDNNITYYITSTVKYAIKDEYAADHIMRMPGRTIRHKLAAGENFEDIVPGDGMSIQEGDLGDSGDGEDSIGRNALKGMIMPFIIPIAKNIFPSLEFTEAIRKCVENETERAIVNLRSQSYTYEEVGKRVGLSTPRISQLMPGIEARFDRHYQ